jgi:histidine phosphotransferase ChpT
MNVHINVVKLLSSRLCHDLVGPAGAVHNGMELVEEMGGDDSGDALKMVSGSVEQLSARLSFFRMAFGIGGLSGRMPPLAESRSMVEAFLQGGRTRLDWSSDEDTILAPIITPPILKLLLNMILVAIDALPRGGTLGVTLADMKTEQQNSAVGVAVKATGEGARLKDDLMSAMLPVDENDLNAHNVHGFFCQRLAAELSAQVEVLPGENEVQFAVLVPEQNER